MFRILLLTGVRLSEILALEKTDLVPAGLSIDESAYNGQGLTRKPDKPDMCRCAAPRDRGMDADRSGASHVPQ
jgi:hypothetical protein